MNVGLRRALPFALVLSGATACGGESSLPPRGQALVVVDTDLPVVGDLAEHPEISPSAAIDSVRIDILDQKNVNALISTQSFTVPDRASWPLSFGISRGALGDSVLVRVRVFRALHALRGATLDSSGVLTPQLELTVDRLAKIAIPSEGVSRLRVLLSGDCLGRPAAFSATDGGGLTCVDAERLSVGYASVALPSSESSAASSSSVGTWRSASDLGCAGEAPVKDATCIPGRMTIIGDPTLTDAGRLLSSAPSFAALVSPFWMDKTEMTVGRYRRLDASGKIKTVALADGTVDRPSVKGAPTTLTEGCTYLGPSNASNDQMPMTCISPELAAETCAAEKGSLPTEVQWEFAARGRGQLARFPWGEAPVTCCRSSVARATEGPTICGGGALGVGAEPVGSHRTVKGRCDDLGDETKEGILDLGGNVSEWTRDTVRAYSHPCWGVGLRIDPTCEEKGLTARIARGSNVVNSFGTSLAATRRTYIAVSFVGFRCVYPAEAASE